MSRMKVVSPQLEVGCLRGVTEVDAHGNRDRGLRFQALCGDMKGVEGVSDKGTVFSVGRNKVMGGDTEEVVDEEMEEEAAAEWNRQASNDARVFLPHKTRPPPPPLPPCEKSILQPHPPTHLPLPRGGKYSREGPVHFQNNALVKERRTRSISGIRQAEGEIMQKEKGWRRREDVDSWGGRWGERQKHPPRFLPKNSLLPLLPLPTLAFLPLWSSSYFTQ